MARTPYGRRSGAVLVNGHRTSLRKLRPLTGYVPSADLLHPLLVRVEGGRMGV